MKTGRVGAIGLVGGALILAGCGAGDEGATPSDADAVAKCKERISRGVNDPASIQFRNLSVEREADFTQTFTHQTNSIGFNSRDDPAKIAMTTPAKSWSVSGEYNSKNAYGGYDPFQGFRCALEHMEKWPADNIVVDKDGWNVTIWKR